ncbi:MAG TPA: copper resistance protein B, partial [Marinobacter adhaerens]|nr:copper resistance protein B [Marinobacter adhaerens]
MSCIRSLAAVSFLASIGFSTTVIAQEMISDTTARKQPLTAWGVQFEEFEYRYSDDDEELGVWNADAFYGTDEFKVRLLTTGEYEIEEQAYETLENQLVGQIPISKFFDAKAGVRFDTPEGPDRTYAVLGVAGLAPQWFEVDANLYASKDGDTSAEIDAEYELL